MSESESESEIVISSFSIDERKIENIMRQEAQHQQHSDNVSICNIMIGHVTTPFVTGVTQVAPSITPYYIKKTTTSQADSCSFGIVYQSGIMETNDRVCPKSNSGYARPGTVLYAQIFIGV